MTSLAYRNTSLPLLFVSALTVTGCIKAPTVVIVDQKTALEKQAAGEYRALDENLEQAALSPKAEDFSADQIANASADARHSPLGESAETFNSAKSDLQWIDELLVAGCVGEGADGLLAKSSKMCSGGLDPREVTRLVNRVNLHRRQLWQTLQRRNPRLTEAQVRKVWRKVHLEQVACGGLVEQDDHSWAKKPC